MIAFTIMVDIPIGLPSKGTPQRACDTAARKVIAPRGSCATLPAEPLRDEEGLVKEIVHAPRTAT